jgi:hypothetical protein
MALPAHSGPRPPIQFRNHFSQTVGLLGRIRPSQSRYLNTGQHKHKMNAYTHRTSVPWVGFSPTIPGSERAKSVHALDRYLVQYIFQNSNVNINAPFQLLWEHCVLLLCTGYTVLYSEIAQFRNRIHVHVYMNTFLLRINSNNSQNVDISYWHTLYKSKGKGKVMLSMYWPWRPLWLGEIEAPTFSDIRLTDGGKVVSPTRRPLFTPRKIPGYYFC